MRKIRSTAADSISFPQNIDEAAALVYGSEFSF